MHTCLECGKRGLKSIQTNHLLYCCGLTRKQYLEKYPFAANDVSTSMYANTLEKQIKKYGEEEGKRRWIEYCERQAYTNSFEYKSKKLGWSEEDFKEYNHSRSQTLENHILRYGEEEGKRRWNEYRSKQAFVGSSEQYFVEKYGEEDGKRRWKEVNRAKGRSIDYYIEKYGEEEGERKYKEIWSKVNFRNGSKISFELWEKVIAKFPELKIYCHNTGKEFGRFNKEAKKYHFYDFVIPDLKLCLEFNGDVYHANPQKFKPDDTPKFRGHTNKKAIEIWEQDNIKNNFLKKEEFDVIIIWESDYRKDKVGTLEKVCNYITQKQKNAKLFL
jgi:G:T-mismatch repair DNA endonuclease (very short patch repair protein)